MRALFSLALLLSTQAFAQDLSSVPYYFAVSEEAHFDLKDKSWKKIPVKEVETDQAYLRGYHFPDTSAAGRRSALKQLLAKEVIQTGDIILSFRPAWEQTIPYAHVQMGVSHASIAWVENGVVRNLDMPLDLDYNGAQLAGSFDSKHHLATNHYQILRPRQFGMARKNILKAWIGELRKNLGSIQTNGLLKFNPDYFATKIDKLGPNDTFVTTMARILLGKNTTSTNLTMFCSEFAWALLSLTNCAPDDAELLNETITDAACVKPIFEPMSLLKNKNIPGLTTGPLMVLQSLDISDSQKAELMAQLFMPGEMNGLSAGHRTLAGNPMIGKLIAALKAYYPAVLNGKNTVATSVASQVNPAGGRNYSPTSFLINSMLEQTDTERKFDYVATILFGL